MLVYSRHLEYDAGGFSSNHLSIRPRHFFGGHYAKRFIKSA